MKLRNLVFPAATTLAFLAGTCALAQTSDQAQQQSVVAAARQSRALKKDASKPVKVFTDDDLSSLKGTISVVGTDAAPAASEKEKSTSADATPKPAVQDEAYWRKRFASARKTLAADSKELDITQREFNLKQQEFYSDPNDALKQQYTREDLNKEQDQINLKKQDVDKDKQALDDLQDELRKSGGDAGWANEQPEQQPDQQQAQPQDQAPQPQQQSSQQQPPQQQQDQQQGQQQGQQDQQQQPQQPQ